MGEIRCRYNPFFVDPAPSGRKSEDYMTETNTQAPAGENLDERLKSWDREKRGLIDDLRKERESRHSMEKELEEIRTALNSAAETPEDNTNQAKVNRLAQDPDGYIQGQVSKILDETVKPLRDEVAALKWERKFEKAYQWLGKQEKKDVDEIYGSEIESEIVRITKENNMTMMDPVEGTKAAYKILKQEQREKEEAEVKRNETISQNSTSFVRNPSSSGSPRFTRAEIQAMSLPQFEKNKEAILEAQRNGMIS